MYGSPEQDLNTLIQISDGSWGASSLPMQWIGGDSYYDGMITPSVATASRGTSGAINAVSGSGAGAGSLLGGLGTGVGQVLGGAGAFINSVGSLFQSKSGGERASDYTTRMVNEYLQNPERALRLYNKNTDLTNPYFQNYMNAMTGNGLTTAQEQMNSFNSSEAQAQRDWQEHMASTQYQRTTADMQAAGLNPAMMYGNSASPASSGNGAAASGSTPSATGVGAIAELLSAAASARVARSSSTLNIANALKTLAESRLLDKQAKTEESRPAEIQSRIDLNEQKISELKAQIALESEQAKSEEVRRSLMASQAILNNVNADNIEALQPYLKQVYSAQSYRDREAAKLSTVEAAYKQGMIDQDVIGSIVRLNNSHASQADVQAEAQRIDNAFRTGDFNYFTHGDFASNLFFSIERVFKALPFSSTSNTASTFNIVTKQ